MPRNYGRVFAAVLIGLVVFVAGVATYPALFPSSRSGTPEGLSIGGYFYVKAYHSDGIVFASWQGHNTMTGNGLMGIASCLSGNGPYIFGTCSPITYYVFADNQFSYRWNATATNTLLPKGCSGTCTGWQARGSISFDHGSLPTNIISAGTAFQAKKGYYDVDQVSISPIAVSMGDYLTITVNFTIS